MGSNCILDSRTMLWKIAALIQLFCGPELALAYVGPLHEQHTTMLSVSGVTGESSLLPCPLNPRAAGDTPKLVLWYRSGDKSPIYCHDGRSKQQQQQQQHHQLENGVMDVKQQQPSILSESTKKSFPSNTNFKQHHSSAAGKKALELTLSQHSATLTLRHTSPSNAGLYECRVDFFRSPSHTSFVNLTVIEPPTRLEILDDSGLEPRRGRLGPYREGDSVTLTCSASEGNPAPNVTWIRNGDLPLDDSYEDDSSGTVRNELTIAEVTRDWQNSTLTCLAVNSNLVAPITRTFMIDLLLLPTSVTVSGPDETVAGTLAVYRCSSEGSEPPAALSWLARDHLTLGETSQFGTLSTSTLTLNVTADDDGAEVICRAANPALPHLHLDNATSTVVKYPPIVEASLGRPLTPTTIKEGDDVYFSCHSRSNPPVTKVIWFHQGVEQTQNVSAGVILSGDALVLQKVGRGRSGSYHCLAINSLASVASKPVNLRIKYLPECQSRTVTYFIYSQPINVTCTFAAHPQVSEILWHWNSSSDVNNSKPIERLQQILTVPLQGLNDMSSAQLTVYPTLSTEDRELTCRGVNELGNQTKSCKFFIKRAKMPAPLSSCRLANITASSLSLTCERPDLPTAATIVYRAQVYLENGTLFANLTSPVPSFNVSHLDQGTNYQIKVYVSQGPITSQPVLVSASTSLNGFRETIGTHTSTPTPGLPLLAVMLGAVLTLLLILTLLLLRRKLCTLLNTGAANSGPGRPRVLDDKIEESNDEGSPGVGNFRGGMRGGGHGREQREVTSSLEDINPDVVPSREETVDLLPHQSPLGLSYYVRYPEPPETDSLERRSLPRSSEEIHPMLPDTEGDGEKGEEDDIGRGWGNAGEGGGGGGVRYNVGVTIGGMGQTVTSIFRSRSRSNNISSFLSQSDNDHETIV